MVLHALHGVRTLKITSAVSELDGQGSTTICWGFIGMRAEAERIKARLTVFLREIVGLELDTAKTLITRAGSRRARFLGYGITVQQLPHEDHQKP